MSLLEHYREEADGIWGIYPHNRHLSPKVRMLLDFLDEVIGHEWEGAALTELYRREEKAVNFGNGGPSGGNPWR